MNFNIWNHAITIFITLICNYGKTVMSSYAWYDNLVTNLKQDSKTYQLLLLYEDDLNNNDYYHLAINISRMVPTRQANFKNILDGNGTNLMLPSYRLETTKIVIIPANDGYGNLSRVLNLLDSVDKMLIPKTLPKVLVAIQVAKRKMYREFLQVLWSKQFLDVTILERKQRVSDTTIAKSLTSDVAKQHYYNPFTKRFVSTTFTRNSILFPDKLWDLNGYKLTIGMFHIPPYVYVNRNSTGHILDISGPDFKLMMQLSVSLNFSIERYISTIKNFRPANCTREYNTGPTRRIIYNENQVFGIQVIIASSCYSKFVQISRATRTYNIIILVPILPTQSRILMTEWHIYNVIIICCLFLMPWMITRFLKFDQRYWKLMYTIQVVLGSSTPQMPRKFVERLTLVTMVGFYFLQSSYIYTTFSNLQILRESSKQMETLEDLVAANLSLILHGTTREDKTDDSIDAYQQLLKNSLFSDESFEACARILMEYRNVSCMGREHLALLTIQKFGIAYSQSRMYILKEIVGVWTGGIYLAGGSPYKIRFQQVASALVESGISQKWDATYFPRAEFPQSQVEQFKQESSVTTKSLNLMMIVCLVGYLCSSIVFAVEMLIHNH